MALTDRLLGMLAGRPLLFALGAYLVSYVLLQCSGLFAPRPEGIMRVLHRGPAVAGAAALVPAALAGIIAAGRGHAAASAAVRSSKRMALTGIILLGSGIVLGSLTRFEGSVMLSEGEEIPLSAGAFLPGTLYQARFSRIPAASIAVSGIGPLLSADNRPLRSHSADILIRKDGFPDVLLRPRTFLPAMSGGVAYSIKDVGYAPHFFLFDRTGDPIEDVYAGMRLFPPGAEDIFRFDVIPHTFSLRYYPDASMVPPRTRKTPPTSGPVYDLRIARNLELIYDRPMTPEDTVSVDALYLSLPDVRTWVEIRVVRDPGVFVMLPGLVLACIGAVRLFLGRSGPA